MTLPLIMTKAGPVATSPTDLRTALVDAVASSDPDFTANLPGSLVEDLVSTGTGILVSLDQARVDSVSDLTPYGSNAFLLSQQGSMLGIPQNTTTNASVYVQFTGTVGYSINSGFVVSDGTYQYVIQEGGVIQSSGTSGLLYAVANQTGTWAIGAGTVTTIVTSYPSTITLSVTNPSAGTEGTGEESVESYRGRLLQEESSPVQGVVGFLKGMIQQVPGVVPRLVSIPAVSGGWEIIVGGGDPYAVGYAIYKGILALNTLKQSATPSRNIVATIIDGNDSYNIPFVNPPQETVVVTTTWNTNLSNFTAGKQVNQLGSAAIQSYVNSIVVGQPFNELEATYAFQEAVNSVLPTKNLTTLTFSVSINGTITPPSAGTNAVYGDPESYFYCAANGAPTSQG